MTRVNATGLCLLAVVGCGRVAFEPVTDASGADGSDGATAGVVTVQVLDDSLAGRTPLGGIDVQFAIDGVFDSAQTDGTGRARSREVDHPIDVYLRLPSDDLVGFFAVEPGTEVIAGGRSNVVTFAGAVDVTVPTPPVSPSDLFVGIDPVCHFEFTTTMSPARLRFVTRCAGEQRSGYIFNYDPVAPLGPAFTIPFDFTLTAATVATPGPWQPAAVRRVDDTTNNRSLVWQGIEAVISGGTVNSPVRQLSADTRTWVEIPGDTSETVLSHYVSRNDFADDAFIIERVSPGLDRTVDYSLFVRAATSADIGSTTVSWTLEGEGAEVDVTRVIIISATETLFAYVPGAQTSIAIPPEIVLGTITEARITPFAFSAFTQADAYRWVEPYSDSVKYEHENVPPGATSFGPTFFNAP